MAIDRTPNATQFSPSSIIAHGIVGPGATVEVDASEDQGSENVASVQYMLRLFSQRNPEEYAALNLTPDIIENQIDWDAESSSVFLPVIGADRAQTEAALSAWRSFVEFFHGNTTDQDFALELYRPKQ